VFSYRALYPEKKILLSGCLSQRYAKDLITSLPEADALFGNRDLSRIAEAAAGALEGRSLLPENPAAPGNDGKSAGKSAGTFDGKSAGAPAGAPAGFSGSAGPGSRPLLSLPGSAYVKIAEGCDNRCAFCAIPAIRGPLVSRSPASVLGECRTLLERGIRELCFIGQDLGSYGKDRDGISAKGRTRLDALLVLVSELPGAFWVRLLYIHPDNFPFEILELFQKDSRLLPYFDLPFQHASKPLLRAMNRGGDRETYLRLLERIRSALPGAVIRSTFLAGFPGETEEDFAELLDFQKEAALDWLGVFCYSREEDTPAYRMKNQVPKKTAGERKRIIEEAQLSISAARMERFIGRTLDVLVEEEMGSGLYLGRLFCQAPEVDGSAVISCENPLVPGSLVRGRVTGRAGIDLEVRVPSRI
jgi:ribosomal protein S12 methylthiotransferase